MISIYKYYIPISNILKGDKMFCYHKEAFEIGFLSASFLFVLVTFFEEPLKKLLEKGSKYLNNLRYSE